MTSSWRHNARFFYLLCSKYMPGFKFVWSLKVWSAEEKKEKIKLEVKCLSWQTLGVRVNCRFNEVSSWWRHNHILENAWRLLWWQYQFHLQNTYIFCVRMCCKKRTVYLNTEQEYTMALSCVMTSSVIFLKSYMSKSICTDTMLKLSNTLALEYCVNYFFTIDGLYDGANCTFISSGCWHMIFWNIKLWLRVWTGS